MTPDAGLLATLLCHCGSAELVAIAPGHPAEISVATDILVRREVPMRAWCMGCWPALAPVLPRRKGRP